MQGFRRGQNGLLPHEPNPQLSSARQINARKQLTAAPDHKETPTEAEQQNSSGSKWAPRNTAEGTEATSAAPPRAMQGRTGAAAQALSGWRGRGFEGPARGGRWGEAARTVQGRTDTLCALALFEKARRGEGGSE